MLIRNRLLPFGSFTAINLFGLIFVRKGRLFTPTDLQHERIHSRQMRELLYLPFYLFYVLEWFFRLFQTRNLLRAYFKISFEREAYLHQNEPDYLSGRTHFAWVHYLRN